MTASATFFPALQAAFQTGQNYLHWNELITDHTTTFEFFTPGLPPITPWGIIVGGQSGIDMFTFILTDGVNNQSIAVTPTSPLINNTTVINTPSSNHLGVHSTRIWPNGTAVTAEFYVLLTPVIGALPFNGGKRADVSIYQQGARNYGAGNGVNLDTTSIILLFGRKYMSVGFGVSSAAVIRLDIFANFYGNSTASSQQVQIYSYTTSGVANDGVADKFEIPPMYGEVRILITKVSGAGGTLFIYAEASDDVS